MLNVLKKFLKDLHSQASSPAYKSAARAGAVCLTTAFVSSNAPLWLQKAFLSSPFLGVIVFILLSLFIFRLWKQYNSDVKVTVFRLVKHSASWSKTFSEEYLWLDPEGLDADTKMRRLRNRKLVRTAVLFVMAQHCIVPTSHLVWVHSLLAYKFTMDVFVLASSYHRQREAKPLSVLLHALKAMFACTVIYHQIFFVSKFYFLVTLIYFMLIQQFFELPLTKALENLQMDFFEGLEQYYVMGFLGFADVIFAFVFMVWALVRHMQFLMLLALYTNIYTGGREIVNNAVTAAFAEWALLAHFERATSQELMQLDDVCAICLANMKTARKTSCRHIFHGHCLRRWLKEKSSCPICSKKIL